MTRDFPAFSRFRARSEHPARSDALALKNRMASWARIRRMTWDDQLVTAHAPGEAFYRMSGTLNRLVQFDSCSDVAVDMLRDAHVPKTFCAGDLFAAVAVITPLLRRRG
jgi:hypothetical protein